MPIMPKTARQLYREADSYARKQGAARTLYASERIEILHNLQAEYGVLTAANVMSAYHPRRDRATLNYLFALMTLTNRAYDFWCEWRGSFKLDGQNVANAAYRTYQDMADWLTRESQKSGGYLGEREIDKIMHIRHRAWLRSL